MPENKDFGDRRVDNAEKVFSWIQKDTKSYVILALSLLCAYLFYLYVQAKNENIVISNDLNTKIQNEIRAQIPGAVKEEVKTQVDPLKQGVEKATGQIDTLVNKLSK